MAPCIVFACKTNSNSDRLSTDYYENLPRDPDCSGGNGNWKLIVSKTDRFFRLHDIAEDPDEANNLVFENLNKYQELKALLALHLERGPALFSHT